MVRKPIWSVIANEFLKLNSLNLNLCVAMQMPNNININILKNMPSFYQDVWQSYYRQCRCKTIKKSLEHMNLYDFLCSTIWGNKLFKFKKKSLFFNIGLTVILSRLVQ